MLPKCKQATCYDIIPGCEFVLAYEESTLWHIRHYKINNKKVLF